MEERKKEVKPENKISRKFVRSTVTHTTMRIRKLIAQKKISAPNSSSLNTLSSSIPSSCTVAAAAVSTTTSLEEERVRVNNLQKPHVGVCELNMSPWDVIPAEDLIYYHPGEDFKLKVLKKEEDYDDDKITNESVNAEEDQIRIEENNIEPDESDTESEEDELEEKRYVMGSKGKLGLKSVTKNNQKRKRDNHDTDDYEKEKKEKRVVYCCKTDGKGWHCRSKAQIGNPLCEHHMIQMQGYILHQRDTYHQRKIRNLEEKKTTRRGRPPNTNTSRRNKGKLSGGKSSEFHYYSGFGPLRGKNKRGRPPNEVKKDAEEEALTRQVIIDEALIRPTSPSSPIMKTVKEEENDNDNGCMFVDDDFDDTTDEDDTNNSVKKRYRKPIKSRSLKSLF